MQCVPCDSYQRGCHQYVPVDASVLPDARECISVGTPEAARCVSEEKAEFRCTEEASEDSSDGVAESSSSGLAELIRVVGLPVPEDEEDEDIFLECRDPNAGPEDLVELMALGDQEMQTYHDGDRMDITVDSGAGESVANPLSLPDFPMLPSAGSKRGQRYRGPGGEVIPNTGEQKLAVKLESGNRRAMTFQSAPVRKPLMAVSGACDRDQFVIFDNDGSFICQRSAPEAAEILRLVRKMKAENKIPLNRKNGTYSMPVWIQPFTRPGM